MTVRIMVGDHTVVMTRVEARAFRDDLSLKINTTTDFHPKMVEPPKINESTGLLEREAVYAFFDQFYESQREVRQRGGAVFNAITPRYPNNNNPIALFCAVCKTPYFNSVMCSSKSNHPEGVDIVDAINNRKYIFGHIGEREQRLRFDMGLLFKHLIQ